MNAYAETLRALSNLLEYPGSEATFVDALERGLETTSASAPGAHSFIERFAEATREMSATDREELYTRTFDINPTCCLEIGWQIYGEAYDRGGLLVKLRGMLRELGIADTTELPDHLTQVLRLMARLDDERALEVGRTLVLPAIRKMLDGLGDGEHPYRNVVVAAREMIERRVGSLEPEEFHV